jgi:glycolate dehydrogenase FAD-binding subunit
MTDLQKLAGSLTDVLGDEHVTRDPDLRIDGLTPTLLARPGSTEEVAACMKICSESDAVVVPAGQMTWLDCGNPLRRADVVLSLERMRRIIDYSPPDLTATVEAGLTLSEFNVVTGAERQWLPLDPPGFRSASLGAIAACNSSGALRTGFGTPRDYVIGLKLVHADGSESKSGGKVGKNVAGYDLNKIYTGSYGTLAIITALTFKLRPLPERSSTIAITAPLRRPLFQLAGRVIATGLQPASVVLTRGLFESLESDWPDDVLLVRFTDSEAAVTHQVDRVTEAIDKECEPTLLSEIEAGAVWSEVADFNNHAMRLKLSVPLAGVPAAFENALLAGLNCVAAADIGTGIIRVAFDATGGSDTDQITRLRASVATAHGTLAIEKASTEVRQAADAWGDVGSTADLMRSIKARFDPHSLLNPGKFVVGL